MRLSLNFGDLSDPLPGGGDPGEEDQLAGLALVCVVLHPGRDADQPSARVDQPAAAVTLCDEFMLYHIALDDN